jgi:DNA replication protein DnaC
MSGSSASILLLGESGVGKTHYGAQLLKRLMNGNGTLRMDGAAVNLEPFEAAMERLNEGMAADHTPTSTYVESVWPIADD